MAPIKLECLSPEQAALLVPVFAIALAEGLDADEAGALGAFIASVGDMVALIGAQRSFFEPEAE